MVTIVSCWRSMAMTFAKKIDRKIGEKTVEKIAGTIGGLSAARIGRSIDAKIVERRRDQTRVVSCEGLIGLIMSPVTMDGKGGIQPVLLRWIGQTDLSESNDRTVRKDRKSLSGLNGLSAPRGRKNRSERGETDENRLWKSYADRLLRGGMP